MPYSLLADMILIMHALFVAFVVGGLVAIVIGALRHWGWVRNRWFRFAHLMAIAIVVLQAWFDRICPLTEWESRLREAAGDAGYSGSFIAHWMHELLFYDVAPGIFTTLYTAFGIAVMLAWRLVPPHRLW